MPHLEIRAEALLRQLGWNRPLEIRVLKTAPFHSEPAPVLANKGQSGYEQSTIEETHASNGIVISFENNGFLDDRFSRELKLTAEAADGVDYYVFYGPEMDTIIHHYRDLTGHAPLFGKWAYRFVQSKDRYTSAQQLLDIAGEYRSQHVPLDVIVQDWFWWKRQGDPVFTDEYLKPHPDVPGALRTLHEEHVHAIISAWAVLDPKSENYRAMAE